MSTQLCPRCQFEVGEGQNFCASCGFALREPAWTQGAGAVRAEEAREQSSTRKARKAKKVRLAGQVIASAMSGAITAMLALILAFIFFSPSNPNETLPPRINIILPAPFEEQNASGAINASGLVPIADSRFLVVDDMTDDAFYELIFTPEGRKAGPLVRRPIVGISSELVEDLEDATLVEMNGSRYIAVISSLEKDEDEVTGAGFVRVTMGADGGLSGEVMPGFRDWLMAAYPELAEGPAGPDSLDVQGLAWDSVRNLILIGVKSATRSGKPLIVTLRVKDWNGSWTTENLEKAQSVTLQIGGDGVAKGIYGIDQHPQEKGFVLIVGDASASQDSFRLYTWDGGSSEKVKPLNDVAFDPRMKPEGIAFGTIGGRKVAVVVDDHGGYYVLWQDEPGG